MIPSQPTTDEPRHPGRRRWKPLLLGLAVAALLLVIVAPRAVTWAVARGDVAQRVGDLSRLERGERRAAIVPGAGVVADRPSAVLSDRIEAAVELLARDRVDVIVMSGDNSTRYYDEPTAMRLRAIELGAPPSRVAADYAGLSTWETCVRAREVFGLRSALIVTNAFHIDRSITLCGAAGIDVTGYSVSDSSFSRAQRVRWRLRELRVTGPALVQAWLVRSGPTVDGEPIDPYDPCDVRRSLAPSDAADEPPLDCG